MSVLKSGDSGNYLNLSHMNMAKNATKVSEDIGRAVTNIIREVRVGGVLVFFQSYHKMQKLLREWESLGLLNEALLGKKLFFEEKDCLKMHAHPGKT